MFVAATESHSLICRRSLGDGVCEQVVFTDHSLFGFADMASILMNKVGTVLTTLPRHCMLALVGKLCSPCWLVGMFVPSR